MIGDTAVVVSLGVLTRLEQLTRSGVPLPEALSQIRHEIESGIEAHKSGATKTIPASEIRKGVFIGEKKRGKR